MPDHRQGSIARKIHSEHYALKDTWILYSIYSNTHQCSVAATHYAEAQAREAPAQVDGCDTAGDDGTGQGVTGRQAWRRRGRPTGLVVGGGERRVIGCWSVSGRISALAGTEGGLRSMLDNLEHRCIQR